MLIQVLIRLSEIMVFTVSVDDVNAFQIRKSMALFMYKQTEPFRPYDDLENNNNKTSSFCKKICMAT